jgi:hypothetical protein
MTGWDGRSVKAIGYRLIKPIKNRLRGNRHRWQRAFMDQQKPKQNALGGGIFIAIGMLGGAIIGVFMGEPSIGMVAGLATGIAIAGLIWIIDRKRHN